MKQWAAAILSLLYLTFSSGFVVHEHFCMNKLVENNSRQENPDRCSNCGMNKKEANDCCKDVHKIVKADTHQKVNEPTCPFIASTAIVPPAFYVSSAIQKSAPLSLVLPIDNAPPLHGDLPIYIFNCVFLI